MKKAIHPIAVAGALALSFLFCGCVERVSFPAMSMAKFVHSPVEDNDAGRVSFSTGWMIYEDVNLETELNGEDDSKTMFFFFPPEGSLSLWLVDNYDLTLSANLGAMMFLEGNLGVDLGKLRVGFLHGVGLGFWGEATDIGDEWEGTLPYAFSAGLVVQSSPSKVGEVFFGFRYTYSAIEPLGGSKQQREEETKRWAHYFNGSLGFIFKAGALRIIPEFIFCYGHYVADPYAGETLTGTGLIIIPTVSLAAAF